MKKYLGLLCSLVIVIAIATFIITEQSCSKDACAGITCQNGGSCANGNCFCTTGYSGTNCQTANNTLYIGRYAGTSVNRSGITPDTVTITAGATAADLSIYFAYLAITLNATATATIITMPLQSVTASGITTNLQGSGLIQPGTTTLGLTTIEPSTNDTTIFTGIKQ